MADFLFMANGFFIMTFSALKKLGDTLPSWGALEAFADESRWSRARMGLFLILFLAYLIEEELARWIVETVGCALSTAFLEAFAAYPTRSITSSMFASEAVGSM